MKRCLDENQCETLHVLCCVCAVPIASNPSMMCVNCLKSQVDVTAGIMRQVMLPHCSNCDRFLGPPWTNCEPESRELLGICLKKIKGLGKVKLIDASFVWTEAHSKRLKVKVTVQKEVMNGAILQQSVIVEFIIQNLQCEDCQKSFTPHTWGACVQVRQKTEHKRTFFWLEQLILKHNAHEKVLFITERPDGVDFHFNSKSHAQSFMNFVDCSLPCKSKHSKHLISHDSKSNTYNYKYTIMCDLCPISKDDLVYVPKSIANANGGVSQLLICHKMSTGVHLIDAPTKNGLDVSAHVYWKRPFYPVASRKHLTEFLVLDVEILEDSLQNNDICGRHFAAGRSRCKLADIEIARISDIGQNDERVTVRSHLGHTVRVGDHVMGYDLRTINIGGGDADAVDLSKYPDVILVKRSYKRRQRAERTWDLNRLDMVRNDKGTEMKNDRYAKDDELEEFKNDLEEDLEMRKEVNLYKNPRYVPRPDDDIVLSDEEDDDLPEVDMAELLEGLTIEEDFAQMPLPEDDDEEL